jgi:dolichol-phosphate mannosyltransferase
MNLPVVIVVPVYNEAENLKILIPKIFKNVKHTQVIIVDDNSTDDTTKIVKELNKKYKTIIHLKRKAKMGRGTAVLHGFRYALKTTQSQIFVEMDADLSHDPDELPKLLELTNSNTVVIASRYLKKSKIVNSPYHRRFLSKLANSLNSLLFGLPIHDNTNGFRLYPRNGVMLLCKHKYKSTGFVTISESTYYLFKKGFILKERPTTFVNRRLGGSKADLHEVFISFRDLLKIRLTKN